MKTMNEILADYTSGRATAEETNAALKEAGAIFRFEPGRNELTEADARATTVGFYPDQANGYGLLDTGTGSMDKVHVTDGRLDGGPVNQVLEDGSTSMSAYVYIGGRRYEVYGDELDEVQEEDVPAWVPAQRPVWAVCGWQDELTKYIPDVGMLHRPEYANRRVVKGALRYRYDSEGYATYAPKDLAQYHRDHGKGD